LTRSFIFYSLFLLIRVCVCACTQLMKMMGKKDGKDAYAEAGNIAQEYIGAIRTVQAYSLQKHAEALYSQKLAEARKQKMKAAMTTGLVRVCHCKPMLKIC
jgi:ABC-type multidrug transport system fused ATPase/permease subunit